MSRDRPKSLGTRSDIAQEAREMTIQSPRSVAPPHNGLMPRSPYRCARLSRCQRLPAPKLPLVHREVRRCAVSTPPQCRQRPSLRGSPRAWSGN